MKRIIAIILACALTLTACGQPAISNNAPASESISKEAENSVQTSETQT